MRVFLKALSVILLLIMDAAAVAASIIIGFGLRYGFNYVIPNYYLNNRVDYILLSICIVLIINGLFGCYYNVWRHAGIGEFFRQVISVVCATVVMLLINWIKLLGMPIELIIIVSILELLFMIAVRGSVRFFSWSQSRVALIRKRKGMKRVLIIGAGEAGSNLVRKLESHPDENRWPVCFIDDNKSLWGKKILGVPVMGGRDKLPEALKSQGIDETIIAIPTASREMLKEVLNCCHKTRCPLRRFGNIDDVNEKYLDSSPISDINLEDLLRRDSVKLNMDVVNRFIRGKTVMVTGGAGSIGSEICRQVLAFGAEKLIIFDIFENGLFDINNELKERFDTSRYELVMGSIRDKERLREVFDQYHPEVIFHAAAHKHVPMMELNPKEAIKNNVFGTINVAEAAILHHTEKFILISTDKAVNPANIMGASKRIAEMVIQLFDKTGDTEFAAVRFGNVLGSSGSVVPYFKKQIAAGGPVTVTHRDMRRYFMTIPEAVQLVLEAGAMADGGEIFVLDMGEPVYIYDLACDLIRLSGFEPDKDIKIMFTGLRPGEKLFEEISLADEDVTKTPNNKIYICKPIEVDEVRLSDVIREIRATVDLHDEDGMFEYVKELVPTFKNAERNII